MTTLDPAAILESGAVLTKRGVIVDLELEDETALFFMTNDGGVLDTDRAQFGSRQERDEALLRTVRLYLDAGWQLAGVKVLREGR